MPNAIPPQPLLSMVASFGPIWKRSSQLKMVNLFVSRNVFEREKTAAAQKSSIRPVLLIHQVGSANSFTLAIAHRHADSLILDAIRGDEAAVAS